jgi:UDP-N-acetylglucosamine 2-epimerase (non-hydrolysing)
VTVKILSVVGARPNFMKIAPLVHAMRRHSEIRHVLVHSGQHYDANLSESFFRDLDIPAPDVNLEVGSGSHAWQTAEVMKRLEPVLLEHKPDVLVVVGDVNSTVAGAMTAAKLGIRIAHVEAGLRSFDRTMPEELNRLLTDAISDFLFVTEESGVRNLRHEGIPDERIFLVGNVMIDSLLRHREIAARSKILEKLGLRDSSGGAKPFALVTLHRPANVDDPVRLRALLDTLATIGKEIPVYFPIHPRTRDRVEKLGAAPESVAGRLVLLDPVGYLDFLCMMDRAKLVLTDSGGIQEETTVLGVPCLTLRENTERPVTIEQGTNQLVGLDPARVLAAAHKVLSGDYPKGRRPPLWDGRAAERIVEILLASKG